MRAKRGYSGTKMLAKPAFRSTALRRKAAGFLLAQPRWPKHPEAITELVGQTPAQATCGALLAWNRADKEREKCQAA